GAAPNCSIEIMRTPASGFMTVLSTFRLYAESGVVAEAIAGIETHGRHEEAVLRVEVLARHVERGLPGGSLEDARLRRGERGGHDLLDDLGDARAEASLDEAQHGLACAFHALHDFRMLGTKVDVHPTR